MMRTRSGHLLLGFGALWMLGLGPLATPCGAQWKHIGPYGGAVWALAIAPSAPNVLYAAGSQLMRSTDGAASWQPVAKRLFAVQALAVDPRSPATVFASPEGPDTLYQSVDGGRSWFSHFARLGHKGIMEVAINPSDPRVIYVAVRYGGLWRSRDGGVTWTYLAVGGAVLFPTAVAISPSNPDVIYVSSIRVSSGTWSTGVGVFKSVDGGGTWASLPGMAGKNTWALAVHPHDPDRVFAASCSAFLSRDGGVTWFPRGQDLPSCIQALAVDPVDPQRLFAGTWSAGVFRSEDGGENWSATNSGLQNLDVAHLAVNPKDPQVLYAGTMGGGVFTSEDGGDSWREANDGFTSVTVTAVHLQSAPARGVYAGTAEAGIFASTVGGQGWQAQRVGLPPGYVTAIRSIPHDPRRVLAGIMGSKAAFLVYSDDGGQTWHEAGGEAPGRSIAALLVEGSSAGAAYAATSSGILKSTDQGTSWSKVPQQPDGYCKALAWASGGAGKVFAATTKGLYTSSDGGATWAKLLAPLPQLQDVDGVAVAPAQPQVVYALNRSHGAARSEDGGQTWKVASTGLSTSLQSFFGFAVSPRDANQVYLAVSNGVFATVNGGREWGAINAGLRGSVTGAVVMDPADDRVLYLGTSQGLARLDLREQQAGQWVPVAARGGGVGGSQWRTDVAILNADGLPAEVALRLHQSGKGVELQRFQLPPRQQVLIQDVLGHAGLSGAGPLEIVSDYPVRALARTYALVSDGALCFAGGTFGQEYTTITPATGLGAGDEVVLPMLVESNRYRTNLLFTNTGGDEATVEVELLDGAGTSLATFTLALPPRSYRQETQPFRGRAGKSNLDRAWARVRVLEGAGVALSASVVDNRTNDPTTLHPVVPRPLLGDATYVQVAARASGLHGSSWRTDLGLLNAGLTTGDAGVKFHGVTPPSSATLAVPPRVQWRIEDVLGALGVSGTGALSVAPTGPIVVTTRTYNQIAASAACAPGGTFGQGYPGLGEHEFTANSQVVFLVGLRESPRFRSNIALTAGAWPVRASIALHDGATGTPVGSFVVSLSGGQYYQDVQPFARRFGRSDIESGYAVVTFESGWALVSASLIDNATNDPITVPAVP